MQDDQYFFHISLSGRTVDLGRDNYWNYVRLVMHNGSGYNENEKRRGRGVMNERLTWDEKGNLHVACTSAD